MESLALSVVEDLSFCIPQLNVLHLVVVLREVDSQGRTYQDARLRQFILSVHIHDIRVERPSAYRGIQEVVDAFVCHQVDGTSQSIASQIGRYYTFVHLYMVDHIHGDIGQCHLDAFRIERYAVDEITNGVARHTIERQFEVRT